MSIKDVRTLEGGDYPLQTFCEQGSFYSCERRNLLLQKKIKIFLKIMMCMHAAAQA